MCRELRKKDVLQDVLRLAHDRSLNKYASIDEEDDFQVSFFYRLGNCFLVWYNSAHFAQEKLTEKKDESTMIFAAQSALWNIAYSKVVWEV